VETKITSSSPPSRWPWRLGWYFSRRSDDESAIVWWEKRRLVYNLLLFLWGIVAIAILAAISTLRSHGSLKDAGGTAVVMGIVYAITWVAANFWYTGGWVVELIVQLCASRRIPSFGPVALLAGTLFSFCFSAVVCTVILSGPLFKGMPNP
jgi:hypothetical protein